MNELHLFAGIGGGILGGLLLGHRCIGAVEIDPYCRSVLQARQDDGCLPPFPIFDDVRAFDGTAWRGKVDVLCGGFPCQPWSQAGKRKGAADPRHLWPEMARIVSECRPRFVFAENVSMAAFAEPWRDLRGMGYRVPPAVQVSAGDLGAPYRRNRWWLLAADTDRDEPRDWPHRWPQEDSGDARHVDRSRLEERQGERRDPRAQQQTAVGAAWRSVAPRLRRLVSGHARRVDSRRDRIRAAGNCQVPQVAAEAFAWLMRTHHRGAKLTTQA